MLPNTQRNPGDNNGLRSVPPRDREKTIEVTQTNLSMFVAGVFRDIHVSSPPLNGLLRFHQRNAVVAASVDRNVVRLAGVVYNHSLKLGYPCRMHMVQTRYRFISGDRVQNVDILVVYPGIYWQNCYW